ncbi:MAG: hypothetical protein MHMPM18_004278, partial [Marteilia pararefringens]
PAPSIAPFNRRPLNCPIRSAPSIAPFNRRPLNCPNNRRGHQLAHSISVLNCRIQSTTSQLPHSIAVGINWPILSPSSIAPFYRRPLICPNSRPH